MPETGWDQRPVCILSLRKLSVFLTTEGMQYTEDGSGTWTVEDTQQIP